MVVVLAVNMKTAHATMVRTTPQRTPHTRAGAKFTATNPTTGFTSNFSTSFSTNPATSYSTNPHNKPCIQKYHIHKHMLENGQGIL